MSNPLPFLRKHRRLTILLAILWSVLILIACFLPARDIPKVRIVLIDKWVHFVIFGMFSFLWMSWMKTADLASGIRILIWTFLFGLSVELVQNSGLTKGRSFEYMDIVADTVGGLIGLLIFSYFHRRVKKE